jgi:hypothetical protein
LLPKMVERCIIPNKVKFIRPIFTFLLSDESIWLYYINGCFINT